MYQCILVPVDGSAFSERALPLAGGLAQATGAHLVLVRAVSVSVFPGVDPTLAEYRAVDPEGNWFDLSEHGYSEAKTAPAVAKEMAKY